MSKLLRVKPDVRAVVFAAHLNSMIALNPNDPYESDDPIVKEHPWAFRSDSDQVEQATAAPGERRAR